MANQHVIALANELLLKADGSDLTQYIQESIEQMDAEFFECLKRETIKQDKRQEFDMIVHMHLEHRQNKVIHIASHGTFSPTNPLKSGVLLKQNDKDKLLAIDEWISQLKAAELIFLSGCDTGKTDLLENEEVFGSLSLFLTRKVGSLILSHWPISNVDETITDIVTDFYRYWIVNGMDKATALQQAIVRHKNHPNPYYWGGLFLSGGL